MVLKTNSIWQFRNLDIFVYKYILDTNIVSNRFWNILSLHVIILKRLYLLVCYLKTKMFTSNELIQTFYLLELYINFF